MNKRARLRTVVLAVGCLACLSAALSPACRGRKPGDDSGTIPQERREGPAPAAAQPVDKAAAQFADRDVLGGLELGKDGDPTFESVASFLPAMKKPREAVGVRYHPHEIGVGPDATLELSDDASIPENLVAYFEVGKPAVRFGAAPGECRKSLVDGVPVVEASFDHEGVRYRQTVFGYSEGLSPDAALCAYVELRADSMELVGKKAGVAFFVGPGNGAGKVKSWDLALDPGVPASLWLKVPFKSPDQGWIEIQRPEFEEKKLEVLDSWKKYLGSGTGLRTPEKRVNEARGAWLAFASLDVDKRDGVLEPHDGSGFYEEVYGYSAALYPHALDLWGRHEEAARILESLLTFQAPDGLFTQHFGTPDPGTLLFAMCEHFELTGDAAWLKRVAPNMIRMAGWIIGKRRGSMTPQDMPRTVTYGLIKFKPYCDFPEETYDYFGDTYCAVGLEKTARALAAIGMTEDADRIGLEAAAYRRDILASMDKAVFDSGGLKVLPIEPETHRILKGSEGRASGYYSLISSCMLESEFLPAADERAGWVMRFLEEKGGLRLGMCEFGGGIDHAYTYGYWLDCLKLDRIKPVILGFYGSLAYGMSRETYSGVEVTRLFTGDNEPTLPHLYSCTQQLRLLRMMLVQEEGDRLWIGRAVPRQWLASEDAIEVTEAPTAFGPVSFVIRPHPNRGRTEIELTAPARRTPEAILLRLRTPGRREITAVKVNGRAIRSFAGETIELKKPTGRLAIEVAYD
jgi:hypothetical protein